MTKVEIKKIEPVFDQDGKVEYCKGIVKIDALEEEPFELHQLAIYDRADDLTEPYHVSRVCDHYADNLVFGNDIMLNVLAFDRFFGNGGRFSKVIPMVSTKAELEAAIEHAYDTNIDYTQLED